MEDVEKDAGACDTFCTGYVNVEDQRLVEPGEHLMLFGNGLDVGETFGNMESVRQQYP
jgi:hypothetical protein